MGKRATQTAAVAVAAQPTGGDGEPIAALATRAFRVPEAAARIGISSAKLYAIVGKGGIAVVRIDGSIRISAPALTDFFAAHTRTGEDARPDPKRIAQSSINRQGGEDAPTAEEA